MILYNTMGRKLEAFKPRYGNVVRVFTCGPSIYRRPHIGNYRTFLYEDILMRYLEFKGYDVRRIINFTDVEDKTIEEAKEHGTNIQVITEQVAEHFHSETELLRIKLPEVIPTAAESVDMAVEVIKVLVEKGNAYWHHGNVFFDPLTHPGFGRLYGLDMSKWPEKRVRFKRDTYNGTRWNRGDFILWHGGDHEYGAVWDTEIGKGRPSWNVQDPAMIVKHLGTEIDIQCGGIDNIYRHHDYTIAVMEAFSGKTYANYFLHGAHLIVEGKSMSKSRGNILYPEDVIRENLSAADLRFFLIYTHYRKKLNYTAEKLSDTKEKLDNLRRVISGLTGAASSDSPDCSDIISNIVPSFEREMDNDLGVGRAFDTTAAALKDCSKRIGAANGRGLRKSDSEALRSALGRVDSVLQVLF